VFFRDSFKALVAFGSKQVVVILGTVEFTVGVPVAILQLCTFEAFDQVSLHNVLFKSLRYLQKTDPAW